MADNFSDIESENTSVGKSDDDSIERKKTVIKKVKIGGVEDSDLSDMESEILSDDENSDTDSELDELDVNEIPIPTRATESDNLIDIESDDDDDDDDDEDYFQKLNEDMQQNILKEHHPELLVSNYEEIEALCTLVRDERGKIIDPFHKTIPYVTRYEKARILGERAKQLNAGATSFIEVDKNIIDGYLIALREFDAKKIPFIVQRPLPNGGCEYWHLRDLEILA